MKDITKARYTNGKPSLRRFHQARWDEPIIFELSNQGERGILIPEVDDQMEGEFEDVLSTIPEGMQRRDPPKLPELSQPQVLRHYVRLSQETLGTDLNIDIGQGTCTMKYSPKIKLVIVGTNDDIAGTGTIEKMVPAWNPEAVLRIIQGADHFYWGKTKELKSIIEEFLDKK